MKRINLLLGVLLLLCIPWAYGGVFDVVQDAFTYETNPDTNYGGQAIVYLNFRTNYMMSSFFI